MAHDLRCDATLWRQDAAGSDLHFRKVVLLGKQVARWKGEGRGSALCPFVGVGDASGGSRFDTPVVLDQGRVRVCELDERSGGPCFVVVKLPLRAHGLDGSYQSYQ